MKIQLFSDLHQEFNNHGFIKIQEDTDIIVLAGDIVVGKDTELIESICKHNPNKKVLYVSGNHEYYGGDVQELNKYYTDLSNSIDNLVFLNNSTYEQDGVVFHGTTLWTGFMCMGEVWKEIGKLESERGISDFYRIKVRGSNMTADIMEGLHKQALSFLSRSLQEHRKNTNVVVTHFPPLVECKHGEIPEGIVDTYFCNDLSELISENNIIAWLYGHNHWSDMFELYNTLFYSNQYGYPRERTGFEFNDFICV